MPRDGDSVIIRPLRETDSLAALTELLHRAYAPLAARGLRYLASHQDEATTRRRCGEGTCLVAELDGRIVGTVTLKSAQNTHGTPWYDRPDVVCFGQFAVDPQHQGSGIARRFLDAVERLAAEQGAAEIALDTAEGAADLIETYQRRGYRFIEYAAWEVTNYRSVIMSKSVRTHEPRG